jgi:toxin-antitoxin system PIN domain toxin
LSEPGFLFDSNVWLALVFDAHPARAAARKAFAHASRRRAACFSRSTQQSFLRLVSTPAILRAYGVESLTNDDALRIYEGIIANPAVEFRDEPEGIAKFWPAYGKLGTASPKVWMDAYLAAFAIAGGLTIVTLDRDFMTFVHAGLNLLVL